MIVVQVLLIAIAALVIVLLLAAPFEVRVRGAWPSRYVLGGASWGGVLVVFRLEVRQGVFSPELAVLGLRVWKGRGGSGPGEEKKSKRDKPKKPGKGKKGLSSGGLLSIVTDRELWGEAISFLRRLLRALRLKAKLEGTYGTDDAALTGILAGIIAVINSDKVILNLQPDFGEEVLDVEGHAKTRFYIGELIWIVLALLWRRPVRRLWLPRFKAKFRFKEAGQHV